MCQKVELSEHIDNRHYSATEAGGAVVRGPSATLSAVWESGTGTAPGRSRVPEGSDRAPLGTAGEGAGACAALPARGTCAEGASGDRGDDRSASGAERADTGCAEANGWADGIRLPATAREHRESRRGARRRYRLADRRAGPLP